MEITEQPAVVAPTDQGTDAVSVVIVDDSPDVRLVVTSVIEVDPNIRVVGEASTPREAVEVVGRVRPDIVILDPHLRSMRSTLSIIRSLERVSQGVRVIVVTSDHSPRARVRSKRAGAVGFVLKNRVIEELPAAIKTVARDAEGPSRVEVRRVLVVESRRAAPAVGVMLSGSTAYGTRFEHDTAATLSEALRCIGSTRYDVILADLDLPDSTGLGTVRILRRAAPGIGLVVLTSGPETEGAQAIRGGAHDYIHADDLSAPLLAKSLAFAIERADLLHEVHVGATKDRLTGVFTRQGFLEAGELLCRLAGRGGDVVTAIYADLDGLKRINESHGRATGDDAIAALARALVETARDTDVVGRVGPDEFVMLGIGAIPIDGFTKRFIARCREESDDLEVNVTASLGFVQQEPTEGVAALIAEASLIAGRQS